MEFCKKVGVGEGRKWGSGGRGGEEWGMEDKSGDTCVYLHTQATHTKKCFLPTTSVARGTRLTCANFHVIMIRIVIHNKNQTQLIRHILVLA